jgi:2-oxoglutarate dehydrogenase E1 component
VIFHEFSGGTANPEDVGGSGDVKYHLGTSTDREFDGIKVHMSLVPNPSHLETVTRWCWARCAPHQAIRDDRRASTSRCCRADPRRRGLCRPGHRLGMLRLFRRPAATTPAAASTSSSTTRSASPPARSSRGSSPYPSDVAKGVQAPILHVNGDDPEAVTFACKLAVEYRQTFHRDVVIDMWCYRRFGHNEGDEPKLHPAADVPQDPPAPRSAKIYADAAGARRRDRPGTRARDGNPTSSPLLEEEFERQELQGQRGRLVRRPLERAQQARPIRKPRAATSTPGSSPSCSTAWAAR